MRRWAREGARKMSETELFTIAPLEWKHSIFADYDDWKQENWQAQTPFGSYGVVQTKDETGATSFRWEYCFDEHYNEGVAECTSVEDGKAKAWAHWLEKITPALVRA